MNRPTFRTKAEYFAFGIAGFTALVALLGSLGASTLVPLLISLIAPALLAGCIWRPWTVAICGLATLTFDALPWVLVLIRGDVEWLGPGLLLAPVLLIVCWLGSILDYAHGRKTLARR